MRLHCGCTLDDGRLTPVCAFHLMEWDPFDVRRRFTSIPVGAGVALAAMDATELTAGMVRAAW